MATPRERPKPPARPSQGPGKPARRDAAEAKALARRGELREAIRSLVRERRREASDIDAVCKRLFEELRRRCPHLLPAGPVEAGETGPDLDLDPRTAGTLLAAAARKLSQGQPAVVWYLGDSELQVVAEKVSVRTGAGRAIVTIPVRCDQTGAAEVTVAFALGSKERPAGLLAATPTRPAGPAEIVEVWGEPLQALAWGALLEVAEGLAHEAGEDPDRAGLIPYALEAGSDYLRVQTMARHAFDRSPR
jgi:hypothetical protein